MSTRKKAKYSIVNSPFFSFLAYQILNLYAKTVRVSIQNVEPVTAHLESGGRVLIASWHQRFFGGFYLPKVMKRNLCIMISASRDGSFISNVVKRIGWIPMRGSSSRRGKEALREMIEGVKALEIGGHIVDGPTGPPRVIKPGLLTIAQRSGAAITIAYVIYENPFVFNSWDRFMIPKPFSRVLLRFSSLEVIPEDLTEEEFEALRRRLEQTMIEEYGKSGISQNS